MTNLLGLAMYLLWAVGTVVVYTIVLYRRRKAYAALRSARTRQDLQSAFALFLTALCSFLAITAVFFGAVGTGIRGFFVAIALGAFFAAGVVKVGEAEHH